MKDIIFHRIYDTVRGFSAQGKPFVKKVRSGLVLAHKNKDGSVEFGYSSVHPLDVYDEKEGFARAMDNRASNPDRASLPTRVRKVFPQVVKHAKKYFADGTFAV